MPRIPAPPLPKALQPKPKKPGESNGQVTTHPAPIEAGIGVVDWLDERTALSGGLRWLLFRKVPRGVNWAYTLGSATLFAFLNQAVTGVFLAMYYRPDASGGAYESIRNINDNVFLGQLVRGMHKWGASV
ncbi:MAG: cytochrome B6, partial [Solirubrobacterales bacterium]|nr:cytochrome B6 [Solirubrobacterales bacterium]